MKLIYRNPEKAYLDSWLWLPKMYVSEVQIRASLSFIYGEEIVEGWEEEPCHFRVPRNYFHPSTIHDLPFPVIDVRQDKFPTVRFESSVVLDAKNPSLDVQKQATEALLNCYDGILCLRCGMGKTVVALHAAAQLNKPILVVVGERGLAKQWAGEIEKCLGIPKSEIGFVGDGKFDWKKKITVAIVNSLAIKAKQLPNEMRRYFGVVIGDEAHILGAPFFNKAIPPFHGRRWGLSATPNRTDGLDPLLRYTFGEIQYTYLMPEIVPKVYFRRLNTNPNFSDPEIKQATHDIRGDLHLGKLYGYFATLDDRTKKIADDVKDAVDKGRQCLVLTQSRDMVDALASYFPNAGICHGGVSGDERFRRIREMNPVIAITRLGQQALDKPSLDTLFVCDPFRKASMLQQTMGRVQRIFSDKKDPVVVFYEDHRIRKLYRICRSVRLTLKRWPENKGGEIPFKNV